MQTDCKGIANRLLRGVEGSESTGSMGFFFSKTFSKSAGLKSRQVLTICHLLSRSAIFFGNIQQVPCRSCEGYCLMGQVPCRSCRGIVSRDMVPCRSCTGYCPVGHSAL